MDSRTPDLLLAPAPLAPADIRRIFVGVLVAMLLGALDQTIVATAMPTIGRELGDVEHLPWIVTAYLLASTAATPLYGKLSDMYGRRLMLLIAIAVFVAASILCALATTVPLLALARGFQGLGGGGLMALSQTIIGDLVPPRERGRYQVWIASVFTTASLVGPVLGGFFAESLHWSLIFWINIPLGALALWLTNERLKLLPRHARPHRLDLLGAALMASATVTLMLALSWGGGRYAWNSAPILALVAGSAVLWAGFAVRLSRAEEPLVPPGLLRDPVIGFGFPAAALGMGTFIALTIFVPIYFEVVRGLTARQSGLALIPLSIAVVGGATIAGRAMAVLTAYKLPPLIGLVVSSAAMLTLAARPEGWSMLTVEILLFLTGAGLGSLFPVTTVASQNAAAPGQLGTVTAASNFFRQLGGAILVAIFGAILFGGGAGETGSLDHRVVPIANFRYLFAAAGIGIAASFLFLLRMEQRPLRTGQPASAEKDRP